MAGVQTSFSLHMADVKAAALAAGRKDIRHYINTLTLDFQKDGLYLVGSVGSDDMTTYLVKVRTPQAFHQFVVPNTTRDQAHAQAVACLQRLRRPVLHRHPADSLRGSA